MTSSSKITILDGGMSRELIKLNAPFRQPEWSALALLEAPHLVREVHRNFAAAGADVVTTNSYALVPFHIGTERFQKQGRELAELAGRLAREAADQEYANSGRKILVAGSLPPIFGSYEPALFDPSRVQEHLSVLVDGLAPYVDFWLGETLSLIAEADAVREAVAATGKPFWIAFTIDDREQKSSGSSLQSSGRLRSGETVSDATRWALESNAESILFNCSRPEFMAPAVRDAKAVFTQDSRTIPIGVYANAFEPRPEGKPANEGMSEIRSDLSTQPYVDFARTWIQKGASIVGGCCGIGCEHIQNLAHTFQNTVSHS